MTTPPRQSIHNPYQTPESDLAPSSTDPKAVEKIKRLANGQKLLIYGLIGNFGTIAVQTLPAPAYLFLAISIIALLVALTGVFFILRALKMPIIFKILYIPCMFIPLLNLLAMLSLNSRATKVLKNHGYKIGLLGVKL